VEGRSCFISNCFATHIGTSTKLWIHGKSPKKKQFDVKTEDFLTYTCMDFMTTNVACAIGPSVNPNYKIGKLKMWTLFCNICINVLNNQIWKEVMLELNGKPSSVTTFSIDFSFQNLEFIWIFSNRTHFKKNIPHIPN
jgi:hypothetical protein